MCSLWSNQFAQCGAINVLTEEQSMCSLCSNQCAHCGAIDVLTVGQSMNALNVEQSTVLTEEQSVCIQIQHSCNSAAAKTINIKSIRRHTLHATIRNQLRTFRDVFLWCAVKGTTVPSVMKMGQRRLQTVSGYVASYSRGMDKFNCGSSMRLH